MGNILLTLVQVVGDGQSPNPERRCCYSLLWNVIMSVNVSQRYLKMKIIRTFVYIKIQSGQPFRSSSFTSAGDCHDALPSRLEVRPKEHYIQCGLGGSEDEERNFSCCPPSFRLRRARDIECFYSPVFYMHQQKPRGRERPGGMGEALKLTAEKKCADVFCRKELRGRKGSAGTFLLTHVADTTHA